ncbi:hypothetical protein MKEN_00874800 [Mycena kentingensis (nom. inval.)]|nr:hypothetical protein MKEN_00874800 [Mycena kentingensis (nom. inval.)]
MPSFAPTDFDALPSAQPNLMPFHIQHDGHAPISTYFLVDAAPETVAKPVEDVEMPDATARETDEQRREKRRVTDSTMRFIATFRGRTIQGLKTALPEGYMGVVMTGGSAPASTKRTTAKAKPKPKSRSGRATRSATRVDDEEEAPEETLGEQKMLVPKGKFSSIVLWHPDIPVDPGRDEYARALTDRSFKYRPQSSQKAMFTSLLLAASVFALSRADTIPNEPSPGAIFNAGQNCHIGWDGDANSTTAWANMAIELMTGPNQAMIHITTVATGLDGTKSGVFDYTCPEVTPNAAIYFYQFTAPGAKSAPWTGTGRFAIASADGQTVEPEETEEANGVTIKWGTGALVDPSTAIAAPDFSGDSSASAAPTSQSQSKPLSSAATTPATSKATSARSTPATTASTSPSPSGTGAAVAAGPVWPLAAALSMLTLFLDDSRNCTLLDFQFLFADTVYLSPRSPPTSVSRATATSLLKQQQPGPTSPRARTSSSSRAELAAPALSSTRSRTTSATSSTSSSGIPTKSPQPSPAKRTPAGATGSPNASVGRASGRALSATLAATNGSVGRTAGRSVGSGTLRKTSSAQQFQPPTPQTPLTPGTPSTPGTPRTPNSPSSRMHSVYAPSSTALRRAANASDPSKSASSSRSVSPAPPAHAEAFASARAAIARGRERSAIRSPVSLDSLSESSLISPLSAGGASSGSGSTLSAVPTPNLGGVSPAVSAVGIQMHVTVPPTADYDVGLKPSLGRDESGWVDSPMPTPLLEKPQQDIIGPPPVSAVRPAAAPSTPASAQIKSRDRTTSSSSRKLAEPSPSPAAQSFADPSNLTPPMPGSTETRLRTTSSNSSLPASRPRSPTSSSTRTAESEREGNRGRSFDAERERSRPGRTASHSRDQEKDRDRVPFPYDDTPALPSAVATSASAVSSPNLNGNVLSVGIPGPHIIRSVSASASTPSSSHIPLAMQHRHRENSAPDARAKLLATAAARAPGSPPQHTMTLAQQHNGPQQVQRTPERVEGGGSGGLERQGSLRGTPELALDMKRLLAKPVSGSPSRVPHSDSEGTSGGEGRRPSLDSSHIRRKHYDASGKRIEEQQRQQPLPQSRKSEDGAGRRNEEQRAREKAEREVALALVGPHAPVQEKEKEKEKEKRPKNVLRRRPSAQRPQTAPSEKPASPVLVGPLLPPASRTAPPVLSLNLSLKPMQLPTFPSSPTMNSPKGSPQENSSGQLTPAGAVVEAYKRQHSPAVSPLPSPTRLPPRKTFSDSGHTPPASPRGAATPATPYYTVFGSTSGRVVAVGGPEDSWDGSGSYISATAFPLLDGVRRGAKNAVGRSLTRKVSERWTKKREDGEEEQVRGRTSSQTERRKKSTRSASRGRTADDSPAEADISVGAKSPMFDEDPGFANEPRSRRSEPALASGGGSKIWKLMKRISTGGLKEKYDRGGSRTLPPLPPMPGMPVPPVPRLPKEHTLETRPAMSSDGHSEEPGVLTRFMQSRTSMSATTRPNAAGSAIPRPSARSLPMPPPIPASQSQPRTSTATRSSSPVSSSENASSKYFHKTTSSGRSSTSSFGEESAPPLPNQPNILVGKHIVPPSELYKLEVDGDFKPSSLDDKKLSIKPMAFFGTRTPDDWRIVATPAEEHAPMSLPHPPRRIPSANATSKERRTSDTPSIPEFSTAAPINAFTPRKSPVSPVSDRPRVENLLASLGPLVAPPRRSTSSTTERARSFGARDDTFGRQNWRTSSAPTTNNEKNNEKPTSEKLSKRKPPNRAMSVPRTPQEPVTFREMTQKAAQLTEKEKADKWEDLLERSNRAGGTIHLGTSDHLASDDVSLRYSASSAQLLNEL